MEVTGEERVDATSFKPKRSGAVIAALIVLLLCAGAVAFVMLRAAPEPLRVLVAVDAQGQWWEGSISAARLLDNVVPHLERVGFDPVDGGDAELLKKLEGSATPEEAARRVGASFIVTGPLKVEVTELGGDTGMVEVRGSGAVSLQHVSGSAQELGMVRTWSGATDKTDALRLASETLGWQTFDVLLPGLMAHEAVQGIIKGNDAVAAGKLTAAKTYLQRRASQLEFAKGAYAEVRQRFAAGDKSPTKITLHTSLTRQDGLCATGAAGFFAKSSAIRPFYSPVRDALGYFEELDRLYWQGAGSKQRQVFEGYNVYGYASASPDGTTAAYVEDLYGAATALHVVRGTSPSKRVFMDRKLRVSDPKVAPGGALVVVWARECARCPAAALVIDVEASKELFRSDPKHESLGGFVWLGPRRLGLLVRQLPAEGGQDAGADEKGEDSAPSQQLLAVDLTVTPPERTVLGSVSGAKLALPGASGDGTRVVFQRYADDGMHLALYDDKTAKLEPLPVSGAHDPAMSPAGDKVAFVRDGDVMLYDLTTRSERALTETGNDFSLRYPQFSLDGRTVYFEVRGKDPIFPKERSLSAIGSVPVR